MPQRLSISKQTLFWVLNTFGWIAFAFAWFTLYTPEKNNSSTLLKFFISNFFIVYVLSSFFLRKVFQTIRKKDRGVMQLTFFILSLSLLSAFLWYFVDVVATVMIFQKNIPPFSYFYSLQSLRVMLSMFILVSAWSTLYFLINLAFDWQDEKHEKEKAILRVSEAKMEVLKNQIKPHFLFNSLNSVSALIEENPQKAQHLIDELSEFLRFSLNNNKDSFVTLKDEIRLIEHFIHIQKIRFENNIEVNYFIDPSTEHIPILSSILYPIVENAIKHGMNTSELPLIINISSKNCLKHLLISIKNSGVWIEQPENKRNSTRTGISNVINRLACEYGSKASFEVLSGSNYVDIHISLPIS